MLLGVIIYAENNFFESVKIAFELEKKTFKTWFTSLFLYKLIYDNLLKYVNLSKHVKMLKYVNLSKHVKMLKYVNLSKHVKLLKYDKKCLNID